MASTQTKSFYDHRDLPGIFMDGDRLCDYLTTDNSILNDNFFNNFDWGVFDTVKHYSKEYQIRRAHYKVKGSTK